MDSLGNKAGKGPLVQWERSGTLGVSPDQTLFVMKKTPRESTHCKGGGATSQNSQGCGWKVDVCFTLNATDIHGVAYETFSYQKDEH